MTREQMIDEAVRRIRDTGQLYVYNWSKVGGEGQSVSLDSMKAICAEFAKIKRDIGEYRPGGTPWYFGS